MRQGLVSLLLTLVSASQLFAATTREILDQAAGAYEESRCEEVLRLYQSIPPASLNELDGISYYRWGYCMAQTRRDGFFDHYQKSADLLAKETETPTASLESWFYRVNALLNLQMPAEASTVARKALERWKSGSLVVSQDDPQAWFRLGKLFRDGGDGQGALEPFRRALAIAESAPGKLRAPYLQRIADHAGQQGDSALASRANALLNQLSPTGASSPRLGRSLVAEGKLKEAREWFEQHSKGASDEVKFNQYALGAIDRALELEAWNLKLNPVNPDGSPVTNLQESLAKTAREAWEVLLKGRIVEVPRKKGGGTRPAVSPDSIAAFAPVQARFAALMLRAVAAGELIREWSIEGGYHPLIIRSWDKLILERENTQRGNQLIMEQTSPDEPPRP